MRITDASILQQYDFVNRQQILSERAEGRPIIRPDFKGHVLGLLHLGRNGGFYPIAFASAMDKLIWINHIQKAKSNPTLEQSIFGMSAINQYVFNSESRLNCSDVFDNCLIIGTDDGLFVGPAQIAAPEQYLGQSLRSSFRKILTLKNIKQLSLIPSHDMILILSGN